MNTAPPSCVKETSRPITGITAAILTLLMTSSPSASSSAAGLLPEDQISEEARRLWETGATTRALEVLDQGVQDYPEALALHKLRGDMLTTFRGAEDAIRAYDEVLATAPSSIDVRWAKWSVLLRSGQTAASTEELRRITQLDARNPLLHLRLAQELRKLDRLEESLESYTKAVDLMPDLLGWRLAMARTRFDLLDREGAAADVQDVLSRLPAGSPLKLPAEALFTVIRGSTQDQGRRFERVLTPEEIMPAQLKEWALMRADAWRLFEAGHFAEAEPMYRKLLALNPRDPTATHQFGLTLMQLGRCREALTVFHALSDLDPSDDQYSDTVFRTGQCLVELQQWDDAFVHFHTLYDAAVEFEIKNKDVALPPGTKVLNTRTIARWLEKVRPHLSAELADAAKTHPQPVTPPADSSRVAPTKEEVAAVLNRLGPEKGLETGGGLVGRDADFSWFRFVIPAGKVMRDDFPTGAHEFIPLNPGDTFPTTQQEIYLVFALVSASYDAVPLTAQCIQEQAEQTGELRPVSQDRVMTSMNDQSGYFLLPPPRSGWAPGLYRCGLFTGERTSADTLVDEVRFRIVEPSRPS